MTIKLFLLKCENCLSKQTNKRFYMISPVKKNKIKKNQKMSENNYWLLL